MPSFDIVSEVDVQELRNAVDQANRELEQRYDFKGTGAKFELKEETVWLSAPSDFQVKQMLDILYQRLTKRGIDVKSLVEGQMETNVSEARLPMKLQQGIETAVAKSITKMIKEEKLKVQASIQGDQVRITGKKRDDLQTVISLLRDKDLSVPLQFVNFRD